jgi:hypothetical protein
VDAASFEVAFLATAAVSVIAVATTVAMPETRVAAAALTGTTGSGNR